METFGKEVAALHAGSTRVYLAGAGAGAGLQGLLTRVPGASATLIESVFPYSKAALTSFLGAEPKKFASRETAIKMARVAYARGCELAKKDGFELETVCGLGLTAVLATNRLLRGAHRVFIALKSRSGMSIVQAEFLKNEAGLSHLGRERESALVDALALNLLLIQAGIDQVPFESEGVTINPEKLAGGTLYQPDGQIDSVDALNPTEHLLFSGSFNPLHNGHKLIAAEAARVSSKEVVYVLNTGHPDKGKVETESVRRRIEQFAWHAPVLVTEELDLYLDKAKAFPGFAFLIGADTLERILDPKYYSFGVEEMLAQFVKLGTHFYVARRPGTRKLSDLLADRFVRYEELFTELATDYDFSSTKIRSDRK